MTSFFSNFFSFGSTSLILEPSPPTQKSLRRCRKDGPKDGFPVGHGYIHIHRRPNHYPRRQSKYRHVGCVWCRALDNGDQASHCIQINLDAGPKVLAWRLRELGWCPRIKYVILAHATRLYRLGPDHEENKTGSIRMTMDPEKRHTWYRYICKGINRKQSDCSGRGGSGIYPDPHLQYMQDMYEELARRHGAQI